MQTITINVQEGVLDKVIDLLKNLSEVEIVNVLPKHKKSADATYPAISFEEAQKKVERSVANISQNRGSDANSVFREILS